MASGSTLVSVAAWGSILAGVLTTCVAVVLIGALFFSKGIPVGGAGAFLVIALGGGLLLIALGPAAIYAGTQLWNGAPWARAFLEIFFWVLAVAIVGGIGYETSRIKSIEADNVIRGSLAFLFTAGPAMAMAMILRSLAR